MALSAKEIVINLINELLNSEVITQEDIIKECFNNDDSLGVYSSPNKHKEKAIEYLNGSVSTNTKAFSSFLRRNKLRINAYKTLELCLCRNKFAYKTKRNYLTYYVKDAYSPLITKEDIVLCERKLKDS